MTNQSHFDVAGEPHKVCRDCGELKSLRNGFYEHRQMADGYLHKCKTCVKERVSDHRQRNLDRIKEYDRNRPNKEIRAAAVLARQREQFKTNPAPLHEALRRWIERNPDKKKAQTAVSNAIRDGRLERQPCEVCGGKAQAHHEDYLKPLEVTWLCPTDHGARHRQINELRRQGVSVSA